MSLISVLEGEAKESGGNKSAVIREALNEWLTLA
jgi:hypothetical protein